jgi:hypothetical protein
MILILIFKFDKITISSLKLSTVPYAAGSESHSRTAYMAIYRCLTASQVSLFVGFLIFLDQPTHENWYSTNKSDFTVYKLTKTR